MKSLRSQKWLIGLGISNSPKQKLALYFTKGPFRILGEVTNQYAGLTLDDPRYAPYLALTEELDIPVSLHTGTMPPG